MFAARAAWDLTPSPLAARSAALQAAGRPLFDLTNANPASLALPGALLASALGEVAREPATRSYQPDPRGEREARDAIAAFHRSQGAEIDAEHVLLTAGTSEGYAHLFRVLADPGDLVHMPTPGYPLFEHLAELEGVRTSRYRLVPAGDAQSWDIDLDGLAAALTPRSRALLAIHPHNPTGAFVSPSDLVSLRAVCAERELALLSDEVFADSGSGSRRSALAGAEHALTCVLSGASKLLGVPQLKIGWIAVGGPAPLRDALLEKLEFAADAFLSVSPIAARVLPKLFAQRGEIRAALNARVATNRAALCRALEAAPRARVLPAEAGWAAIVRVRTHLADEALALRALERAGVRIHPGALFELEAEPGVASLVVGLLAPEAELAEGALALANVLREIEPAT